MYVLDMFFVDAVVNGFIFYQKKGGKLSDHLSIWKIQTVYQITSCCPRLLNWKPPRLEANLDTERQGCILLSLMLPDVLNLLNLYYFIINYISIHFTSRHFISLHFTSLHFTSLYFPFLSFPFLIYLVLIYL